MDLAHEKVFDAIIVFGLGLLVIAFILISSNNLTLSDGQILACSKDADCILVSSGCCGCSMGGNQTAINKQYLGYWSKKYLENCDLEACPKLISESTNCLGEARCADGKCSLLSPKSY